MALGRRKILVSVGKGPAKVQYVWSAYGFLDAADIVEYLDTDIECKRPISFDALTKALNVALDLAARGECKRVVESGTKAPTAEDIEAEILTLTAEVQERAFADDGYHGLRNVAVSSIAAKRQQLKPLPTVYTKENAQKERIIDVSYTSID